MKNNSVINLQDYRTPGSRVFTGRDRGIEVREASKIDLIEKESDEMNRVILATSRKRLGQTKSSLDYAKENKEWSFFHAGLLTAFENSVTYNLAGNSLFHLKYKCEAHRLALILENIVYCK